MISLSTRYRFLLLTLTLNDSLSSNRHYLGLRALVYCKRSSWRSLFFMISSHCIQYFLFEIDLGRTESTVRSLMESIGSFSYERTQFSLFIEYQQVDSEYLWEISFRVFEASSCCWHLSYALINFIQFSILIWFSWMYTCSMTLVALN
jgi:hypothetical protein